MLVREALLGRGPLRPEHSTSHSAKFRCAQVSSGLAAARMCWDAGRMKVQWPRPRYARCEPWPGAWPPRAAPTSEWPTIRLWSSLALEALESDDLTPFVLFEMSLPGFNREIELALTTISRLEQQADAIDFTIGPAPMDYLAPWKLQKEPFRVVHGEDLFGWSIWAHHAVTSARTTLAERCGYKKPITPA